jgi:hypothetical protein
MGSIPLCVWGWWSSLEIWKGAQNVFGRYAATCRTISSKNNLLYDSLFIKLINRASAVFQLLNTQNQPNTNTYIKKNQFS